MSRDKIKGAIDVLVEQIDKLLHEIAEKKRVVNSLCANIGDDPIYQDVDAGPGASSRPIRPDQFYGRPFSTVVREFLEMKGTACTAELITQALREGGFKFPWAENQLRNVAISLAKNSSIFHRVPNGAFGLLSWYPEAQKDQEKGKIVPITNEDKKGGEGRIDKEPESDP